MKKIKTLIKSPCLTMSGYGTDSRQRIKSLLADPKYDVYLEPLNWGNTPFMSEDTEERRVLKSLIQKRIVEQHNGDNKFDLFIHITIPNEFERLGTYNVGITAGTETTKVSHTWLEKCNQMDLIIVPSEHTKKAFVDSVYEGQNQQTGQKVTLKLEKPIVVCPEGVNTEIFNNLPTTSKIIDDCLSEAPDFNFLCVGQWANGGYGEDRKNIANTVKYFIETFYGEKDVGLVLKTNMSRNSMMDFEAVTGRLKEIKANYKESEVPPIFLIHANLTDQEMASLYKHPKIKAMLSLTAGEGFGLPLIEATACELPVLATNWSGHLDFLKLGKFSAIDYDLKEIPDAAVWADILIKGSKWAVVKEEDVKRKLNKFSRSPNRPKEWAVDLGKKIREKFNIPTIGKTFADTIDKHLKDSQASIQINPIEHLQAAIDTPDDFNVIYTMPMSAGDVFISTSVIDGLKDELPEGAKIYFATKPQYMEILKDNPNIHKVIPWNESMITTDLLEEVFDLALTPNVCTQYMFSNWVRRGQGRMLAEEFANHCNCELGDYFIKTDNSVLNSFVSWAPVDSNTPAYVTENYITFHPGSGKGQWEARNYHDWNEVLVNLKNYYPGLKIVQIGEKDDMTSSAVDVDLRGKTDVHQMASVIANSSLHVGIDSLPVHICAGFNIPVVALYGSSYARSTGPKFKNMKTAKFALLEPENRLGCTKACYKYSCAKNKDCSCINGIDAFSVFENCVKILKNCE